MAPDYSTTFGDICKDCRHTKNQAKFSLAENSLGSRLQRPIGRVTNSRAACRI
jgi:hypothetical protein